MQVFISWSGERSKKVAEELKSWLSKVIQAVEPWISTEIEKGSRWNPEISEKLENTKVGIICLTSENLHEPWILFEAGAISKTKDAIACTFLIDLERSDVQPPLSQFQHTTTDKKDVLLLLKTINKKVNECEEKSLDEKVLEEVFKKYWPDLEESIEKVLKEESRPKRRKRSDREILAEILQIVRELGRRKEIQPTKGILSGMLSSPQLHPPGFKKTAFENLQLDVLSKLLAETKGDKK